MIQTVGGGVGDGDGDIAQGRVPTTVYHSLPRARTVNGPLLIFIPGNPGIINYYIPYFQELSSQFAHLEILGISHAGHSITVAETFDAVFSLQNQIDHKVAIIEEYLQKSGSDDDKDDDDDDDVVVDKDDIYKSRDVLIMGHSVGTWIMERIVLKMSDRVNFKFIGFITPTIIDIHKSEKGKILYPLVKLIPFFNTLVAKFSLILRLLPDRIITFILSQVLSNAPSHALESTKAFISNNEYIRQSLGLATEEMHTIQSDWQYLEHFLQATRKIPKWFFFSNVDHWVDNRTQHEIMERINDAENCFAENSDELLHSFCVNQSLEFAEITTKVLNELYINKK